jgi:hypothetical protein
VVVVGAGESAVLRCWLEKQWELQEWEWIVVHIPTVAMVVVGFGRCRWDCCCL